MNLKLNRKEEHMEDFEDILGAFNSEEKPSKPEVKVEEPKKTYNNYGENQGGYKKPYNNNYNNNNIYEKHI